MKKSLILSLAFLLPGCSGADVSKFIGGTWTGSGSINLNCSGQTSSVTSNLSIELSEGSNSDLAGGKSGCIYEFRVNSAGDTATLSNGPVTCSDTQNGTTAQVTVTAFTLKTPDGHHLTVHTEGSMSGGGQSCTFVGDATASK